MITLSFEFCDRILDRCAGRQFLDLAPFNQPHPRRESTFPGRVKDIEEICGKAIPYEVDWDSFKDDPEALNFVDNISRHRLNVALRVICQDDMGKEAVRDGLKLVKLNNVKDAASKHMNFSGGVLEMPCPYALGASGMFSDSETRKTLEDGL